MGVPVNLSHTKYPRNAFLFNLVFLVDASYPKLSNYFDSIELNLQKLSHYLITLERESEYLSMQEKTILKLNEVQEKPSILNLIETIYYSLNENFYSQIHIDAANTIYLRFSATHNAPIPISNYQVPIPFISTSYDEITTQKLLGLWNAKSIAKKQNWDLGLRKIIPFIDGVSHVKKISLDSEMDESIVIKALNHLLYYNFIKVIDLFQYNNIYVTNTSIKTFFQDQKLQQECIVYITQDPSKSPPSLNIICRLFSLFKSNIQVKILFQDPSLKDSNIDLKKFISFSLLNGLIRRIHKYPSSISPQIPQNFFFLKNYADGKHCYDELSVTFGLTSN